MFEHHYLFPEVVICCFPSLICLTLTLAYSAFHLPLLHFPPRPLPPPATNVASRCGKWVNESSFQVSFKGGNI